MIYPGYLHVLLLAAICSGRVHADSSADGPHETQSAQCTITAGDVQASAQATISKRLDGVCGSGTLTAPPAHRIPITHTPLTHHFSVQPSATRPFV